MDRPGAFAREYLTASGAVEITAHKPARTSAHLWASKEAGSAPAPVADMEWCMISVRWIEEKHPEYARGTLAGSARSAKDHLRRSLAIMSYCDSEEELGLIPSAKNERERIISSWSKAEHHKMVAFIESGGYKPARGSALDADSLEEAVAFVFDKSKSVATAAPAAPAKPPAEELMDDVIMFANPAAGSW
jgi:hypothetical protein